MRGRQEVFVERRRRRFWRRRAAAWNDVHRLKTSRRQVQKLEAGNTDLLLSVPCLKLSLTNSCWVSPTPKIISQVSAPNELVKFFPPPLKEYLTSRPGYRSL